MQMKKKIKEEKASISVYVFIVLFTYLIILSSIYFTLISVNKAQLRTILKIKQSYELDNGNAEQIYQEKVNLRSEYIKNGLILHYDGYNNTGKGHSENTMIWKDLSGNNNDGNLSGNLIDGVYYWDNNNITISGGNGTLNSYVDTPINLSGRERTIIYTIDGANLSGSVWGDTNANNACGLFNYNAFIANRGADKNEQNKYAYTFSKNGIYNYAVTLSSSEMKFYVNGQLITTIANTMGLLSENNLRILAAYYEGQNATNIKMYNFMVYDRLLSENEVLQNYNVIQRKYQ